MITDTLNHFERYIALHPGFEKVAAFLKETDLSCLKDGHYEIAGNDIFVNINTYETKSAPKVEFHKKYIDVQIVLSGLEQIGWVPTKQVDIDTPYDAIKDIAFGSCATDKLTAKPGLFFIFFPEDAHQPGMTLQTTQTVKKVVFKVKL